MSRIIIAGCGVIGTTLGLELAENGHDVWGIRRHASNITHPIRPLEIDLSQPASIINLPSVDYIYIILTPDAFDDMSYKQCYVDCTCNLLDYLDQHNVLLSHIFFVSSTSVYGQKNGEWVTESSPTSPDAFSGKRILEAEQHLRQSSYPTSSIRCAGIYGNNRLRLIRKLTANGSYIGSKHTYRNLIHEDDVVRILHSLLSTVPKKSIYIAVDSYPVSEYELINWLSTQLDVPKQESLVDNDTSPQRNQSNKRCHNQNISETGFEFLYPTFREGYGAVISTLKSS